MTFFFPLFFLEGLYKYSPFTDKGRHKKYPQIFANVMNPDYHVARPKDVDLKLLSPSENNGRMSRLEIYDPDCYDLISCLLEREPSQRLGYSRTLGTITIGGGRNIMAHKFFSGGVGNNAHLFPVIDFLLLEQRQLEPPWVPQFTDEMPTKHMRKNVKKKDKGRVVKPTEMVQKIKSEEKRATMIKQFEEWAMVHNAVKNSSIRPSEKN